MGLLAGTLQPVARQAASTLTRHHEFVGEAGQEQLVRSEAAGLGATLILPEHGDEHDGYSSFMGSSKT